MGAPREICIGFVGANETREDNWLDGRFAVTDFYHPDNKIARECDYVKCFLSRLQKEALETAQLISKRLSGFGN